MIRFGLSPATRSRAAAALATWSLAAGFLLLSGCGQTGPLTLEEPASETDTESDADEDER